MPGPLLTEPQRDAIAIASAVATLVGFPLTVLSVFYAIRQIRKTRSAAEAARAAARDVLVESRSRISEYLYVNLQLYVDQAEKSVSRSPWDPAILRMDDLAAHATRLAEVDESWGEMSKELHNMAGKLRRIAEGDLKETAEHRRRWHNLLEKLRAKIGERPGLFQTSTEGHLP